MKKVSIFFSVACILVILSGMVTSLGITPARTTIDFSPNLERDVTFSVLNSEHQNMKLVVYVQGELNESIRISENIVSVSASEESRQLSYRVILPPQLRPGLHTAEVVVLQLPEGGQTSEAFVGATVGAATQLYVQVPYPGKFIEAAFDVINVEQGNEAVFVIPVVNRGNLDVEHVRANIDIYSKLNQKIATLNTDEISVTSGSRGELVHRWKADVEVGTYRAVASVISDGEVQTLEQQFTVGNAELALEEVKVRNFRLGEIAKLEMLVENKWSEPIVDAYAETQVFNSAHEIIADFKSPTYTIPPLQKTIMTLYWDTAGLRVGTYDASVFLKYAQTSTRQDITFKVSDTTIDVVGLGYVISESHGSSDDEGSSLVTILIVAIVILVLMNIVWFMVVRKKLLGRSVVTVKKNSG